MDFLENRMLHCKAASFLKKSILFLLLLALCFFECGLLQACTPNETTIIPLRVTDTTLVTQTHPPTKSVTSTRTLIATQTSSVAPTKTYAPTPTPTPRPLPTRGDLSAKEFFLQLVQTNGGCELPCWWGIVPGSTTWDQVKELVSSFSPVIESRYGPYYTIHLNIANLAPIVFVIGADDNIVKVIEIYPSVTTYRFTLNQFFINNGIPSKIYIHTIAYAPRISHGYVDLVLFYENEHFYVNFSADADISDDQTTVTSCFEEGATIYIFPDHENFTDQEILEMFIGPITEDTPKYTLSIEEALNMTPEEFYLQYKNTENNCVTTPLDVWP